MKIDIAVLTETKKKGNGIECLLDYIHIYRGVPKSERTAIDASIIINKKYKDKTHN